MGEKAPDHGLLFDEDKECFVMKLDPGFTGRHESILIGNKLLQITSLISGQVNVVLMKNVAWGNFNFNDSQYEVVGHARSE